MELQNIKYIDLPCRVKACTFPNDDGSFTILINARLSFEQQQAALAHELRHIENGDHYKETATVSDIEYSVRNVALVN